MGRSFTDVGIDAAAVRCSALAELGAPPDLPVLAMPPLTPVGTLDRPPLDLEELDPRAWRVLTWRQQHLPLSRVRSAAHLATLTSWEERVAGRVADKASVDDDQRYSLVVHHRRAVEGCLGRVLARVDHPNPTCAAKAGWSPYRRPHMVPTFMLGWPTWFANRRVGMRDRWFRLTRAPAYRGQPGGSTTDSAQAAANFAVLVPRTDRRPVTDPQMTLSHRTSPEAPAFHRQRARMGDTRQTSVLAGVGYARAALAWRSRV